jgi:molecular chaperone HtpG
MAGELETYAFNADISQLMSLIINAFYSNKEIFLRELISNASDAMDKIRHQALQDPEKLAAQHDFYIRISPDREARTLTVEDSGIAMTRDEMINNLGTIAKSGTKAFMEAISMGSDLSMIGQFGVGFYSAYLVSEKVLVVSKSNDDEQHIWESAAGGTFKVWKDTTFEHGTIKRGTKVICYLKDDQMEFLESDRLKDMILKHSAFVGFPIHLLHDRLVEGSDTPQYEWELVNKNKPVWLREPDQVTHQEHADLYKWLAGDWEDHLGVRHVQQKGQVEYKALLYCPRSAPKDMFDMGKMSQRFSIRLYVRRVFIKEFNDLVPKWMGFIKGIVDSDDMPLNIGREKLQQNAILKHIQTGLQKQAFHLFNEVSNDKERSNDFHAAFSQCLKLGVYEDHANRDNIIPLLRYHSSKSGDSLVSLDEYIGRMKPGQKYILYITGRSRRDAARSPYIESLTRDGFEVLYMFDPVDEYAVQFLKEYKGKEVMSCMNVSAASLLDRRTQDDIKAEMEPLRRQIQDFLRDRVKQVRFGDGISAESCGRVVDDQGGTLELNIKHGLLRELLRRSDASDTTEMPSLFSLLYDAALLDGSDPDDPRRAEVCEQIQGLNQKLSAGDRDTGGDDLPSLNAETTLPPLEVKVRDSKKSETISCGNVVRVVRSDVARRAIISFVDDDAKTVDVMFTLPDGNTEEEEGIPVSVVRPLLKCETESALPSIPNILSNFFQASSDLKEHGNELFKLKDFEAAQERYTLVIEAFKARTCSHGQQVLVPSNDNGKPELVLTIVRSVDAEGECELGNGMVTHVSTVLPVTPEILPLHSSVYTNRARCRQNLGMHKEASQDLSIVLGLWRAADKRMLEADPEMRDAEAKAIYTAEYLRGRSRLARGLVKQAAADVKSALTRNPPPATVKQLRQLKEEVNKALEKHRNLTAPLTKELAKMSISLRGMPTIS